MRETVFLSGISQTVSILIRDYVLTLGFFMVILAGTYAFQRNLKNKPDSSKRLLLSIIAVLVLTLEATRQAVAIVRGYTADNLPLYICSLFLPIIALTAFSKKDSKHNRVGHALLHAIGLPVAASIVLVPFVVFDLQEYGSATQRIFTTGAVFRHYHSFFFHMLSLFFVSLSVVLRPYKLQNGDMFIACFSFLAFVLLSTLTSRVLGVDYTKIWALSCYVPLPLLIILYQLLPLSGCLLSLWLQSFIKRDDYRCCKQ